MTAREQLAYEVRRSWLVAERDARQRRLRRKALRRANLWPKVTGIIVFLLIIAALWGPNP